MDKILDFNHKRKTVLTKRDLYSFNAKILLYYKHQRGTGLYFTDSLKCPGKQRNIARHTDFLDFDKLAGSAARLLHPEGVFSVIIPADGKESFLMAATRYGLHLSHQTFIHTKPGSEPKRVLLAFKFSVDKCVIDDLTIELSRHVYSEEYIALTKEFYLNM